MKPKKMSRISVIAICITMILSTALFGPMPKVSAQGSWMQTTDIDFEQNNLTTVRIMENGTPAYVELNEMTRFTWVDMGASGAPRARESFGMAYDEHNQVAVIFGGTYYDPMIGMTYLDDTWEYDYGTNTWTNITKPTRPPLRSDHDMAYDSENKVIVLFGGWFDNGITEPINYDDTWEYDVTTKDWNQVFPSPKPAGRDSHAMTYDSANKRVLLFGGISAGMVPNQYDDTWAYDASSDSWNQISTPTKPDKRFMHDMAYDSTNNLVVMHSGMAIQGMSLIKYLDTWEFDCNSDTWLETTDPSSPGYRIKHDMAFYTWDNATMVILFGGSGFGGHKDETWAYFAESPGFNWTKPSTLVSPSKRHGHGIVYDSANEFIILFGGSDSSGQVNDTWVLTSTQVYVDWGYMVSTDCDSGETVPPKPNWQIVSWNPVTQPAGTTLWILLANSTDGTNWGDFVGPDGTKFTFYDNPEGQYIWSGHNGKKHLRYIALFSSSNPFASPRLEDINLTWDLPPGRPPNLKVERDFISGDIVLDWSPTVGATEYHVYESQDRFAGWPWAILGTVSAPGTQFRHVGALTNGTMHYYIVRSSNGTDEGGNSTMGVKAHLSFSKNVIPNLTDINWLSLPYNSIYKKASDIASELTEAKIRVVGKWNPVKQKAITYTYAKGKWKGADFDIDPGEGIFIAGLQTDFDWIVTGTDSEISLGFTYYPNAKKNINWISVPYTGIYTSASSIVTDIEGSLLIPPTKIVEVGKWNRATQTSAKFYWDGGSWTGTDFTVDPGDGIYLQIISSFGWPITQITPPVP